MTKRTLAEPGESGRQTEPDVETRVDLARLTDLIADGQIEWPADLSASLQEELELRVRQKHKSELTQFIAGLIATQLFRTQAKEQPTC